MNSAPHRKVQVWIFSRDKAGNPRCLLLKTNAARGAFWQPVTGTVEDGESFDAAAGREAAEETGFPFGAAPADAGYEFEFASRFGPALERTYALEVAGETVPKLDPKEHDAHRWVTPAEALALVRHPSNAEGLRKAYKLVFGRELGETKT